jgi:starch synthase
MRVLFVTGEAHPLAKTGGLADVSSALPIALSRRGVDVRLLLPGYPGALERIEKPRLAANLEPILGVSEAKLISGRLPNTEIPVFLIDAPVLFRRNGGLYQDSRGQDWEDNALRFAFLSHVAARLAMGRIEVSWVPDVVHANDWHAGLVPLLLSLETIPRPATVFTTHNMAFQGNFAPRVLSAIGVPEACFLSGDIEFYGQVSFLKAGLRHSDHLTTVSPTYASEVLTPEYGCGMDGLLRERIQSFSGILNGIDDALWNPDGDSHLPQSYRPGDVAGKRVCKSALQRELGLPVDPQAPLVAFVSRLTQQKMADTILAALPWLAAQGAQFVLLGEGEPELEAQFKAAQSRYKHHAVAHIGYDEALAHRLQAGSDILLAPARFEPCGLTQLYALRYGTPPVVRQTGGLADTVVDANPDTIADRTATGFVFEEPSLEGLTGAVDRALSLYREPLAWRRLQLQGMAQDFSWNASAKAYASLYHHVAGIEEPPADDDLGTSRFEQENARQATM